MAPSSSARACALGLFCTTIDTTSAARAQIASCGLRSASSTGASPPTASRSLAWSMDSTRSARSSSSAARTATSSGGSDADALDASADAIDCIVTATSSVRACMAS